MLDLEAVHDLIVAATIATEVPPNPVHTEPSTITFTAPMIMAAQQAVAEVIFNRSKATGFPDLPVQVVLDPKQFSAVMRGISAKALGHRDIWRDAIAGVWFPEHVEECLNAWRMVKHNSTATPVVPLVPGALYYYSPVSMRPPMSRPAWVVGLEHVPCAAIASDYFSFYR